MNEDITEQAVLWHEALAGDEADWDGFTRWLEADPRHRSAYDEIALIDDLVARNRSTLAAIVPEAAPAPPASARPRRQALAGTVAAAALAVLLVPAALLMRPEPAPAPHWFASRAAETRQLALADGTRIALSPSSRLAVAGGGEELTLAGSASFDVPHRPDRQLTVRAGGIALQDIGTRFEVATAPGVVRVAVAEGRLEAQLADGQRIAVAAGKRLLVDTARGTAELTAFPVADYAAWRGGRLVYDNAPLALVAAEVGRYAGTEIRINPDVSARRFSGILMIGNGSGLVRNLAKFMDLDVHPEGGAVRLVPRGAGGGGGARAAR